ncbi:hypothetical protein EXS72_01185 [Candidatus Pacearchaeota archaeon]|nr:hypothetical protein [Candidatus Pacearchaeota archaeon]
MKYLYDLNAEIEVAGLLGEPLTKKEISELIRESRKEGRPITGEYPFKEIPENNRRASDMIDDEIRQIYNM